MIELARLTEMDTSKIGEKPCVEDFEMWGNVCLVGPEGAVTDNKAQKGGGRPVL